MSPRTSPAVLDGMLALLAPGWALPRDPGSVLGRLLSAPAAELARVEGRAGALLDEADPRVAADLLPDWERAAGLPDPCLGPAPTIAQRRARLVQQLTQTRGQSRQFLARVATSLLGGGDLRIALLAPGLLLAPLRLDRPHPAGAQVAVLGGPAQLGTARLGMVTEFAEHDCEQSCEAPVHGPDWRFAWRLGLPAATVTDQTCEDGCETPLAVWGDTTVECVLRGLAPAHTIPIFAYG